ncbi:MAG TPA: SCO family protein [Anaeromyxobacteraceae bacterium]
MRRSCLTGLAALALASAGACAHGGRSTSATETSPALVAGSVRRFPNPSLVTQDGQAVRFYDDLVQGRVVMVSFGYTRCQGSCPRSTAQLVAVQRLLGERFGRDVTLLTLSLDPEHDTPEAMRAYTTAHGGRPGWTWLTGRRDDIEAIRRFVGFTDRDPAVDADRTRHTALVLIGNDRTGRWSSVPALIRPELIVEALLRTAGERPQLAAQGQCEATSQQH